MMGQWQKQTELWAEPGELRQTDSTRSFTKKGQVAGFYGNNGHVSVDPVIIIKLMLLLFLDDVRSESLCVLFLFAWTISGS
ncbi:MAG TPA: hypothetical protein VIS99_11630 [Terrimicrobiaceae bacterium]